MKVLMCVAAAAALSVSMAQANDAACPAPKKATASACKATCGAMAKQSACAADKCAKACGSKEQAATKAQTTCPVMAGNAIDKQVFADHEGQRIYFCCKGCIAKFKADPAAYLKKLAELGVKPEATPAS